MKISEISIKRPSIIIDRKSTRLNSSHVRISYAVFCLKKKNKLADAIQTLVGHAPKENIHPATRVYQALRIHFNDELGDLAKVPFSSERALKPGAPAVF